MPALYSAGIHKHPKTMTFSKIHNFKMLHPSKLAKFELLIKCTPKSYDWLGFTEIW